MTNTRTATLVAVFVGLTALVAAIGTVALLVMGQAADAALAGLTGTALGYLTGLVTPGPTVGPVTVRADEALPVDPQ